MLVSKIDRLGSRLLDCFTMMVKRDCFLCDGVERETVPMLVKRMTVSMSCDGEDNSLFVLDILVASALHMH